MFNLTLFYDSVGNCRGLGEQMIHYFDCCVAVYHNLK